MTSRHTQPLLFCGIFDFRSIDGNPSGSVVDTAYVVEKRNEGNSLDQKIQLLCSLGCPFRIHHEEGTVSTVLGERSYYFQCGKLATGRRIRLDVISTEQFPTEPWSIIHLLQDNALFYALIL